MYGSIERVNRYKRGHLWRRRYHGELMEEEISWGTYGGDVIMEMML
jgi:hypothetical protein